MKYSEEIIKEIITLIESGATNKEAAILASVSEETFYKWKRSKLADGAPNPEYHPEFPELLKKASIKRKVAMVNRILSAAKKSWQAAAWYLERKYNSEYGRREKHEIEINPQEEMKKIDKRIKERWPEKEDTTNSSQPPTSGMTGDSLTG